MACDCVILCLSVRYNIYINESYHCRKVIVNDNIELTPSVLRTSDEEKTKFQKNSFKEHRQVSKVYLQGSLTL